MQVCRAHVCIEVIHLSIQKSEGFAGNLDLFIQIEELQPQLRVVVCDFQLPSFHVNHRYFEIIRIF
jgi:hypothetical protein